jgi:hypothetical protein
VVAGRALHDLIRRTGAGLVAVVLLSGIVAAGRAHAAEGPWVGVFSIAGDAYATYPGVRVAEGGVATQTGLFLPGGPAVARDGTVLVPDRNHGRVVAIGPDGTLRTVAGGRRRGSRGDGRPATRARLDRPNVVAALPGGGFLVGDEIDQRVRRVSARGVIRTVAGGGRRRRDGAPARKFALGRPSALAALPGGGFLVASGYTIRHVDKRGRIHSVAGARSYGFSGDGGSARRAALRPVQSLAALPSGGFLLADTFNGRVRKVDANGMITTVAGTTSPPYAGEGGSAVAADLSWPVAVMALDDAHFLVASVKRSIFGQDEMRISLVDGAGTIRTAIGPEQFSDFAGRVIGPTGLGGLSPGHAALAATADGGLVFNAPLAIAYAAPEHAQRTAIRIVTARLTPGQPHVEVSTTRAGMASVSVTSAGYHVSSEPHPIARGRTALAFESPPGGRVSALEVVLRADTGVATDRVRVLTGGELPIDLAVEAYGSWIESPWEVEPADCTRMTAMRVDCEMQEPSRHRCDWVAALELSPDGILRQSSYDCAQPGEPRFRLDPVSRTTPDVLPL